MNLTLKKSTAVGLQAIFNNHLQNFYVNGLSYLAETSKVSMIASKQ